MKYGDKVAVHTVIGVVGTFALAGAARWVAGTHPPTAILLFPILAAAYVARVPGGLATTAAACISAQQVFGRTGPQGHARIAILFALGIAVTVVLEALHRARAQTEHDKSTLAASARRFAELFSSSPVAMTVARLDDGIIVDANIAYRCLFGLSTAESVGKTGVETDLSIDHARRQELRAALGERGWIRDVAVTVKTPVGQRRVRMSSQVIEFAGVPHVISTYIDETARLDAEDRASDQETLFHELAEHLDEVIWVLSPTADRVYYMSPAYQRILDRSSSELAADPMAWMSAIHPDDKASVLALFGHADLRGEITFRVQRRDGVQRHLRAKYFPIRDASGNTVRVAGLTRDVTEQIQLEEQVRQSQKLESLGLLAGGVAHDFNNILAVIGANAGMIGETATGEQCELVDDVEQAVHRGTSMTRQLLAFSRRQDVAPVVIDINRTVDETRKMLRRMVGEDVTLTSSLEPDLHPILVDPSSIVQVLMNLAVNARDAMSAGGQLSLVTRNVQASNGEEVLLEVTDSGTGMSPEIQARIFEPFFTTKEEGKGTGLGLSVVHGIVRQAGGRIELSSDVGRGTTFRLYFPAVLGECASANVDVEERCVRGCERVVLVDDDAFVRASAARALRGRGYDVIEAPDGKAALEVIEREGSSIAMLVTDVVMPGMDGRELAQKARGVVPKLRVLYTTGYADDAVSRHGVLRSEIDLLEKPFGTRQLAGRVRRMIDTREAG
ncbi:MAG TPA: ATP-binding protein [Kofleriaceae bacterium]